MDQSTPVKKIPLILVTGFLGSGKTSLLKKILEEIGHSRKIAVVQNEFSPGTVDSAELKSSGIPFSLLEINNGSVFCACLLDSFIERMAEFIHTYQPEAIFLEATGLADPVSMAQVMQATEVENQIFLGGIWTVVDCANFNRSHKYIQRVRHQIQIADIVLLNKSDLSYPGQEMREQILTWNPHARQYISRNGLFDSLRETLFDGLDNPDSKTLHMNGSGIEESMPRPDIGSCVIRTHKVFTEEAVRKFHVKNKDLIMRMKGYTRGKSGQYYLVQSVFDRIDIQPADNWSGPTEIIIMGPGIRPGPISKEFLTYGNNE